MKDRFGNVPYALFRTDDGRTLAWTREDVELAQRTAKLCRCGKCDCCRCDEYVRETQKDKCLCGAARVNEWTAGVHHGAHRCARVITKVAP